MSATAKCREPAESAVGSRNCDDVAVGNIVFLEINAQQHRENCRRLYDRCHPIRVNASVCARIAVSTGNRSMLLAP